MMKIKKQLAEVFEHKFWIKQYQFVQADTAQGCLIGKVMTRELISKIKKDKVAASVISARYWKSRSKSIPTINKKRNSQINKKCVSYYPMINLNPK